MERFLRGRGDEGNGESWTGGVGGVRAPDHHDQEEDESHHQTQLPGRQDEIAGKIADKKRN
jgi:hypothetical protein